jgi:hypothetical protein
MLLAERFLGRVRWDAVRLFPLRNAEQMAGLSFVSGRTNSREEGVLFLSEGGVL